MQHTIEDDTAFTDVLALDHILDDEVVGLLNLALEDVTHSIHAHVYIDRFIAELKEHKDLLRDAITAHLAANNLESFSTPVANVKLITTTRSSLSKERLVELGVSIKTLALATTEKTSTSIRITKKP